MIKYLILNKIKCFQVTCTSCNKHEIFSDTLQGKKSAYLDGWIMDGKKHFCGNCMKKKREKEKNHEKQKGLTPRG